MSNVPKPKPAPATAQPLFHPFDWSPPSAEACLDTVYAAFERYDIGYTFCEQCFDREVERRQRSVRDIRKAGSDVFAMIYFESPQCFGGIETFLHWLPRGLELSFFDTQPYPSLLGKMVQNRLPLWPEHELDALRQLFCRALVNWIETGEPTPLGIIEEHKYPSLMPKRKREALAEIFSALILLRVDMATVLSGITERQCDDPWPILLDLLRSEFPRYDYDVFCVPEDKADILLMRDAIAALKRRARDDTFRIIDRPRLLAKWLDVSETNPPLAQELADFEALYDVYDARQTEEERAQDERRIVLGFKLDR